MHEAFGDELRERLLNYTEEPEKDLWRGIDPRIDTVNLKPGWIVWSSRLPVAVFVLSTILILYRNKAVNFEKDAVNHVDTKAEDGDPLRRTQGNDSMVSNEGENSIGLHKHLGTSGHELSGSHMKTITEGDDLAQKTYKRRLHWKSPNAEENDSMREWGEPIAGKETSHNISNENQPLETDVAKLVFSIPPTSENKKLVASNDSSKAQLSRVPGETKKNIETKRPSKMKKSFALYFTAMPTFGYQRIEPNVDDELLIEGIKRVPAFSAERLGVRLEIGAETPLSKRWKAFSGLLYYQRKQTIEYTETRGDSTTAGKAGGAGLVLEHPLTSKQKSIEHELKNIGLQVGVTYQLWMKDRKPAAKEALSSKTMSPKKRRFSHVIGTGLEFHKALRENRSLETAQGYSDPSAYVFFNMYYRLQYPKAGPLRAVFQPTLNYSVYINRDLNAPFYVKPYGLGLNFGCTYHLR